MRENKMKKARGNRVMASKNANKTRKALSKNPTDMNMMPWEKKHGS